MAIPERDRLGSIQATPKLGSGLRYEVLHLDATLVLVHDKALPTFPECPQIVQVGVLRPVLLEHLASIPADAIVGVKENKVSPSGGPERAGEPVFADGLPERFAHAGPVVKQVVVVERVLRQHGISLHAMDATSALVHVFAELRPQVGVALAVHFSVLVVGVEVGDLLAVMNDLRLVRAVQSVGKDVPRQPQPEVWFGGLWVSQAAKPSEQAVLAKISSVAHVFVLHWCASTDFPLRTGGNDASRRRIAQLGSVAAHGNRW